MAVKPEKSVYAQRSLLGAILFVIFLASLAGAWWLSTTRTAMVDNGASLLKEIRSQKDGLRHYWGQQTVADFYVIRDKQQKPVAWSATIRIPLADGYQIVDFQPAAGTQHQVGIWSLWNGLNKGEYKSHELLLAFDGNQIKAQSAKSKVPAGAEMPANFLPEIMLPLAASLLTEKNSGASFKTVDPESAVLNGQFNFGVSYFQPQNATTMQVKTDSAAAGSQTILYEFDGKKVLQKIHYVKAGLTHELTPPDKVLELFLKDTTLRALAQAAQSLPADDSPLRNLLFPQPVHPAVEMP